MKILIIEGDLSAAETESDYLRGGGFECDIATNTEAGLWMARENDYSLVIIGTALQDGSLLQMKLNMIQKADGSREKNTLGNRDPSAAVFENGIDRLLNCLRIQGFAVRNCTEL